MHVPGGRKSANALGGFSIWGSGSLQLPLDIAQELRCWSHPLGTDAPLVCAPQLGEHGVVHHLVLVWIRVGHRQGAGTLTPAPMQRLERSEEDAIGPSLTPITDHAVDLPEVGLWKLVAGSACRVLWNRSSLSSSRVVALV